MTRPTSAQIDLNALKANLMRVRKAAPESRIMAVIKADAYGHGMLRVACTLSDVNTDAFGVASLEEAVQLRDVGVTQRIVLLEGFFNQDELMLIEHLQLDLVVHDPVQLAALEQVQVSKPLNIWLKLDTGMHRLGFSLDEIELVLQRLRGTKSVGEIRLMSHLACADDRQNEATSHQCHLFAETTDTLGLERSLANSGGLLGWPEAHYDWVRPGLMLYGVSPFVDHTAVDEGLVPVMTLTTEIIAVKHYQQGDAIGYGGNWRCPKDMPVGVAAIGYGDGYPRHAKSGTSVLVNGQLCQLIGRVSMDMITLDLSNLPDTRVGDLVTLWGQGLPVEQVAAQADTIPYALLCGVTSRVPRLYGDMQLAARAG